MFPFIVYYSGHPFTQGRHYNGRRSIKFMTFYLVRGTGGVSCSSSRHSRIMNDDEEN